MAIERRTVIGERTGAGSVFRLPGITLGVGLGGLLDGVVLHQVLQWHHLVDSRFPVRDMASYRLNVLADGLFHLAMWAVLAVGAALTIRAWRRNPESRPGLRVSYGWLLFGWGLFDLADGLIFHHLLGLHHVRPGPGSLLWDLGWDLLAVLLLAVGWALAHPGNAAGDEPA